MAYYKQPPKRRKSLLKGIITVIAMTLFGVITHQTKDTLR